MKITETERVIYKMLVENTGTHILDSGGDYGRKWQENQNHPIGDFMNGPEVIPEFWDGKLISYTISLFHYLRRQLELDNICREFNKVNIDNDNWDDDRFFGVSAEAGEILNKYEFTIQNTFNSYNGDSALSQIIQGTYLKKDDISYLLLQIHGGCDARGGYTDARLFCLPDNGGWECLSCEDVYGTWNDKQIDNTYDGYSLRLENDVGTEIEIKETDSLSLHLAC